MSNLPTVFEVLLTDVADVVVSGNSASTILPHTHQLDFTTHLCDTVLIFVMVGGGTTVNGLQALHALRICVKA